MKPELYLCLHRSHLERAESPCDVISRRRSRLMQAVFHITTGCWMIIPVSARNGTADKVPAVEYGIRHRSLTPSTVGKGNTIALAPIPPCCFGTNAWSIHQGYGSRQRDTICTSPRRKKKSKRKKTKCTQDPEVGTKSSAILSASLFRHLIYHFVPTVAS